MRTLIFSILVVLVFGSSLSIASVEGEPMTAAEARVAAVIICDRRGGDPEFKEICDRLLEALKATQSERLAERRRGDLEEVKRAVETLDTK